MSTFRNPVGPQPPSVYWRRRLVVGAGIVAVVVVILLIVFRPGSGAPAPEGAETPGDVAASVAPTAPAQSPTAPAGDVAACAPGSVGLTPVTDSGSYGNGDDPMISMEITNIGATACSFDVGTGAQEYLIMSGTDRIWSSRDCQENPTESVIVLEPGVTLATEPFPWDRTRSSEEICAASRPEVIAGGATYRLSVMLGEARSEDDLPFILE